MGNLNTTELSNLANLSYDDFKNLALLGQNRAELYYTRLGSRSFHRRLLGGHILVVQFFVFHELHALL